jgi:Mce-associated membrane protein
VESGGGKFSTEVIAPAVRDKGVRATAQVVRAALMEIRPDHAKVLLFLNQ